MIITKYALEKEMLNPYGYTKEMIIDPDISIEGILAYVKQTKRLKIAVLDSTGEVIAYKRKREYYGFKFKKTKLKSRWVKEIRHLSVIEL